MNPNLRFQYEVAMANLDSQKIRELSKALWGGAQVKKREDLKAGQHIRCFFRYEHGLRIEPVQVCGKPFKVKFLEYSRTWKVRTYMMRSYEPRAYLHEFYLGDLGIGNNRHGSALFRFDNEVRAALDLLSEQSEFAQFCAWFGLPPCIESFEKFHNGLEDERLEKQAINDMMRYTHDHY
jgi:hypothetical protein